MKQKLTTTSITSMNITAETTNTTTAATTTTASRPQDQNKKQTRILPKTTTVLIARFWPVHSDSLGLLGSARHNVFLCKWNGENCVLKQEPQIINSILGIITTYQFIITTYQSLQLHISYYNYMSVIITTYQLS